MRLNLQLGNYLFILGGQIQEIELLGSSHPQGKKERKRSVLIMWTIGTH